MIFLEPKVVALTAAGATAKKESENTDFVHSMHRANTRAPARCQKLHLCVADHSSITRVKFGHAGQNMPLYLQLSYTNVLVAESAMGFCTCSWTTKCDRIDCPDKL